MKDAQTYHNNAKKQVCMQNICFLIMIIFYPIKINYAIK
jgi:hypothetical protein